MPLFVMLNNLEAPAPPPHFWSWKKIILWPLGVLLAMLVALWAWDQKLEPWDDLQPLEATDTDPGRNGYFFLKQRWEALPELKSKREVLIDLLSGKTPWDPALVAEMRRGRESLLPDIREAVARPEFKTPAILSYKDTEAMDLSWMVSPNRMLSIEIRAALREGNTEKALELWRDQRALAFRTVEGSQSIIAFLVGASLHSMAMSSANELLASGKLSADQLRSMDAILQQPLPAVAAWRRAIRSEAVFSRSAITDVAENRPDLHSALKVKLAWLLLKKNTTINRSMREMRHVSQVAFKTFPDKASATAAGYFREETPAVKKWKRYLDPNYAGTTLLEAGGSYRSILPGMANRLLFEPRAMRVKIALLRWREAHPDQWPATLRELTPDFLTEIPEDPFNGHDLSWDPVKKVIFSVGADWEPNAPKFKDHLSWFASDNLFPGLRMELPPPPAPASSPPP